MTIAPGVYELDPESADLVVRTGTEGAAAAMGHALTLGVSSWSADFTATDDLEGCSLRAEFDLSTLLVRSGTGGVTALTEPNKRDIIANAAKALGHKGSALATFVSTTVTGDWDRALITGDLTLHGKTQPLTFTAVRSEGEFTVTGTLVQTAFGIKPFSTMLGALRLRDAVEIEVKVNFD